MRLSRCKCGWYVNASAVLIEVGRWGEHHGHRSHSVDALLLLIEIGNCHARGQPDNPPRSGVGDRTNLMTCLSRIDSHGFGVTEAIGVRNAVVFDEFSSLTEIPCVAAL